MKHKMISYKIYAFKESGRYYSETTIKLPDKFSDELQEDILSGNLSTPWSTMTRIFIPQENTDKGYPFMIKTA